MRKAVFFKYPQTGTVVIEDDVEIGANSTIDRATLRETRIGRGTKIDNLVQIAHNVVIGEDCILASQVGISGSAKIGRGVIMGRPCWDSGSCRNWRWRKNWEPAPVCRRV